MQIPNILLQIPNKIYIPLVKALRTHPEHCLSLTWKHGQGEGSKGKRKNEKGKCRNKIKYEIKNTIQINIYHTHQS